MNPASTSSLVHNFLENSSDAFPNKIALIHEQTRINYYKLNAKANKLAHWLLSRGITAGDRVVFIFENCLEYVVSYYGILKAGAVAVPMSSDIKPDGLLPLLIKLEPKAIILSSRFERLLKATNPSSIKIHALIIKNPKLKWTGHPFKMIQWEDIFQDKGASNPELIIDETALASIIYTSGSTGMPKGVMLSHRNIVSNVHSICQYLSITHEDIQMVVLPFFYVMGKSLLNTHFAAGGTVVINNKFAYPASVVQQMVDEKVTAFSGVPSTYAYLLHRSPLGKYRDRLGSLRYCSQAGGHMSDQIKKNLRRVLPEHTQIYIMYGATEASSRLSYLEPDRYLEKMGSIGKPIPGVYLRILNEDESPTPVDRLGELVASGPNIMQGYWKDKQTTARRVNPNGYHTGDLGYQDKEGYFFVTGRKDDQLKVGGHLINTQEVADAIVATDLVVEAVVFGVPDKLLGKKLISVAAPKNHDISVRQIMSLCADKLPRYKLPMEVKLVRSLPKFGNGKINRTKCLELAQR